MTTFFVVSAVGQSASGFVVDKLGPRIGLFSGLLFLFSSAFVLGFAQNVPTLFIAAALAGLGNSVFHPADYSLMNYNIGPSYLGHAFAWHNITGNIGWAICPLFMVTIAEHFGWRVAAISASSVALIVFIIEFCFRSIFNKDQLSENEDRSEQSQVPEGTMFGFLKVPAVWLCFLFFFFTSGAFGVLQSFSQTIFGHAYGLDLAAASGALTGYLLGAGAGALCGGFLTNRPRISCDKVVGASLAFAAFMSLILASQILSGYWAIVLMTFMGYGTGLAAPSRDIMIRRATLNKVGMKALGRVYGFTYCGMDCGQSLSPIVFGPLLDAQLFTTALLGVAILQTLSIFTALRVGDNKEASQKTEIEPA